VKKSSACLPSNGVVKSHVAALRHVKKNLQ
jgi:hypothetical protein